MKLNLKTLPRTFHYHEKLCLMYRSFVSTVCEVTFNSTIFCILSFLNIKLESFKSDEISKLLFLHLDGVVILRELFLPPPTKMRSKVSI